MYTSIFQNSYVVLILSFIGLSVLFYFLEIGYNIELQNGKVVKKFSWKYPLSISLIVWVVWHFFLYPPPSQANLNIPLNNYTNKPITPSQLFIPKSNKLSAQKINMMNWN